MNYSGVGVIAIDQDGKFLLHLRDGNTNTFTHQWCLVGGSVEQEESVLVCAVREMKEETSLTLHNPVLLGEFMWEHRCIALIKGDINTDKETIILGEGAELRLFTDEEALKMLNELRYTNPYLDQFKAYILESDRRIYGEV